MARTVLTDEDFKTDAPALTDGDFKSDSVLTDADFSPSKKDEHDALFDSEGMIDVAAKQVAKYSPWGAIQQLVTGKPFYDKDTEKTISDNPIPATIGRIIGGITTAAPALATGMGAPAAFAGASTLGETQDLADRIVDPNFQPTPAQLAAKLGIAGATGAVTGRILDTPMPGKDILARAGQQGVGAGATALTGDIASQAVEGKEPDIKQAAKNAALNTVIYGVSKGLMDLPELRDTVQTEGSRIAGKNLPYEDAKAVVKEAGINPEQLSPEFIESAYQNRRADFVKNTIEPMMEKYGASEDIVKGVLQDQDLNMRDQALTKWATDYAKTDPEGYAKVAPYFEQIKAGADPVDVMMTADLKDKILGPLKSKVEQSIEEPGQNPIAEFAETNKPKILEDYGGKHGNLISNDLMKKEFSPIGYTGEDSKPYQSEAGKLTKEYFDQKLNAIKGNGDDVVLMTGGTGTGKSTLIDKLPKDNLIFDVNLTKPDQNSKLVQQILDSGNRPVITFVMRHPVDAYVNGVIKRLVDKSSPDYGRVIGVDEHTQIHDKAFSTFRHLINKFAGQISYKIIDNRGELGQAKEIPFAELHKAGYTYSDAKTELENYVKSHPNLTEAQRQTLLRPLNDKANAAQPTGQQAPIGRSLEQGSQKAGSNPQEIASKSKLSSESGQAILPIETAAKAAKEIINLVSPTSFVPKPALDTAFKMKGDRERAEFQIENQMLDMEKAFDKMPKTSQVSFVDNIKRGLKQPTPALQVVADMMRQIEDAYWKEAKQYKPSLPYLDNHYRVLWKVIPGQKAAQTKAGFKGIFRRPLQGSKGFAKQHTLADMSEGLALGGEPHSYNPVTMWRNAIMDMQKFITAQRMFKAMKDMGYVKFVKFGSRAPDDFVKLNDTIAKVYFPADPGMVNAGEFYIEENTGRILNNFLSKDWIKDSAIGGNLLKFKNITTAMELSLSPFHASYVSLAAMASDVGLGLQKMVNRGLIQHNGDAFLSGLASIGTVGSAGPAKFTGAGAALIKYVSKDSFKNSKAGKDFLKKFPDADALIEDLFQGGAKLAMHQDYKINSLKAFKEGIKNKEPWAVTISALPAANEMIMKPLFEIYIPRMKIGAFLHEMSNELVQRQPELANGKLTRAELARQVWGSIENRFGEMNFDNMFWNRTFKSALQLVFRSVTWKVGALKNIEGGVVDQFVEIKNAIEQNRAPLLNRNTSYLLGIALLVTAFSEIIMHLFLGEGPKDLKDILAPRYDKEGNRISLNTHIKDWIHLAHSPLKFIQNSLSGEIGRMVDVWQNKDFYNTQIFNPKDPAYKQALDKAKHLFPTPFSLSSQQKLKGDQAPAALKAAVGLGIAQPSPGYISQSEALQKAREINGNKPAVTLTQEQKDHNDFKKQILTDLENTGKYGPINAAYKSGKINDKEYNQIRGDVKKTPLERAANHMSFDEVATVMEKASPEELKLLKPIFIQKIDRKILNATKDDYQYLKELKAETLKRF